LDACRASSPLRYTVWLKIGIDIGIDLTYGTVQYRCMVEYW